MHIYSTRVSIIITSQWAKYLMVGSEVYDFEHNFLPEWVLLLLGCYGNESLSWHKLPMHSAAATDDGIF